MAYDNVHEAIAGDVGATDGDGTVKLSDLVLWPWFCEQGFV